MAANSLGRFDGILVFHAANPAGEKRKMSDIKDIVERSIGDMLFDTTSARAGSTWMDQYIGTHPDKIRLRISNPFSGGAIWAGYLYCRLPHLLGRVLTLF